MPDANLIRASYRARPKPEYFHDNRRGVVYQPDIYQAASLVAARIEARRIVDVGCGTAAKLIALGESFALAGIDYGPNIAACRQRYRDAADWIEADLDTAGPLPVSEDLLRGSVLICSDVIEHVVEPRLLLDKLRDALEHSEALVISTPERELTYDQVEMGPPRNRAHVREWSIREFAALMRRAGFPYGSVGVTRTEDATSTLATILGGYVRDPAHLDAIEDALIDMPAVAAPPHGLTWVIRRLRRSRLRL